MPTATATPDSGWIVRLSTDATGAGAWYRATYSGQDVRIADTPEAVDGIPPLNTPLDYYWTGAAGVAAAPRVTVASSGPVLSRVDGIGATLVTVVDQPPLRFEGRSVVHPVIGRRDPLVSVLPMLYPRGRMRLYARDRIERVNLITLMDTGGALALRSTCPEAVDDLVFVVMGHEDPLVSESAKRGARWIDIEYQAISQTPSDYLPPPQWSWGDVEDSFGSWADVEAAYFNWASLEAGP